MCECVAGWLAGCLMLLRANNIVKEKRRIERREMKESEQEGKGGTGAVRTEGRREKGRNGGKGGRGGGGRGSGIGRGGGKRIKERVGDEGVGSAGERMSHVQSRAIGWMKMKDQHQSNDEPLGFPMNPERGATGPSGPSGEAAAAAAAAAAVVVDPEQGPAQESVHLATEKKEMTRKWISYANLIK